MKHIIILILSFLFFSGSATSQTKAEFLNVLKEKTKYDLREKAFLKKVTKNSVLIFLQSNGTNENVFQRGLLVESKDDLSLLEVKEGGYYDILIPEHQRFIVLASAEKSKSIIIGLYDVHDKIHNIISSFSKDKPLAFFVYGISYMQSVWDKNTALNSKSSNPLYVLTAANENIDPKIKKSYLSTYLVGPGGGGGASPVCHSGGPGSSQCNIEQGFPTTNVCGVTCNSGYYACCNTSTFTCKCYPNAPNNL